MSKLKQTRSPLVYPRHRVFWGCSRQAVRTTPEDPVGPRPEASLKQELGSIKPATTRHRRFAEPLVPWRSAAEALQRHRHRRCRRSRCRSGDRGWEFGMAFSVYFGQSGLGLVSRMELKAFQTHLS